MWESEANLRMKNADSESVSMYDGIDWWHVRSVIWNASQAFEDSKNKICKSIQNTKVTNRLHLQSSLISKLLFFPKCLRKRVPELGNHILRNERTSLLTERDAARCARDYAASRSGENRDL